MTLPARRIALMLALAAVPAACSDTAAPSGPAVVTATAALSQLVPAGSLVPVRPAVRVAAPSDRPLEGVLVTFSVERGGGTITGAEQHTDANGVATVGSWTLGSAPGTNTLRAAVAGITGTLVFEAVALPEGCADLASLDLPLGGFSRLRDASSTTWPCLWFDAQTSAGSEYVLLLENLSPTGSFGAALFPGPASDSILPFTLSIAPVTAPEPDPAASSIAVRSRSVDVFALPDPSAGEDEAYTWDFGAGRIREHVPDPPLRADQPQLVRGNRMTDLNTASSALVPGDTIAVLMEGIPRLGISIGEQKAVIRYVSDELIIAEDIRLAELPRQGGGFNTPIADEDLAAIAAEYRAVARVQGDMFFEGRHNEAVESGNPQRITAVHSLMPADDVWGYTYTFTNYFVWDYWVATNGSTKGLNQHPQRVTDNLFMHEIAHMRHFGLLRRSGLNLNSRGNRWLVEGFARFIERLPIAARLLGQTTPSRTDNVVLPRNPAFGNAYFLDDVPTYLYAGSSMYFGYHTSAFVFDYFADQVALTGGDWQRALREFLVAGASSSALDNVIGRWLPGTTFANLFSRSRIALYCDDIGISGLPAWTQYHQFRLRESRPAPQQLASQDPRVAWPRISPSAAAVITGRVAAGGAAGFVIDGADAASGVIRIEAPAGAHGGLSVARIR